MKKAILVFVLAVLVMALFASVAVSAHNHHPHRVVCALVPPGPPVLMLAWQAQELDARILPREACSGN